MPDKVSGQRIIETRKIVFLIMEYASGGELFNYIVDKEKLEEIRHFHEKDMQYVPRDPE